MKKRLKKNTYMIRKVVEATCLAEAIQKEKKAIPLEVIMVITEGKQYTPAIGFGFTSVRDQNEEEEG